MENNLELGRMISFNELIQHGLNNGANVVNDMPWSWKINGKAITHENNHCYLIETIDGFKRFEHPDKLIAFGDGLKIMTSSFNDTHSPGGCPLWKK